MQFDERLLSIAHRLSSQSATLELELCALESRGDEVEEIGANLRLVAKTLAALARKIEDCAAEYTEGAD